MKRNLLLISFLTFQIIFSFGQRSNDQILPINIKPNTAFTNNRGLTLFPGNWLNSSGADLLTYSGGGYVNGNNAFGDLAKGQVFHNDKPYMVEGASFWIGALEGNTGSVKFTIWNFNGEPGSVIASKSMTVAQLKNFVLFADPFYLEFDEPVLVQKDFMIGIELSDLGTSQIGLVSSKDGDGGGLNLVWEQWSTGSWYSYHDAGSWNIDIDLGIFPSVIDIQNSDFAGGIGTVNDPYQIANAVQLNKIRNYNDAFFIQTADIDLGIPPWNSEKGWLPIGNILHPFTVSYNGDRHSISNLTINRPDIDFQGLFGFVTSSEITNLNVLNTNIKGNQYTAGLAGRAENSSIDKVEIRGQIQGGNYTGGVCGMYTGDMLQKAFVHALIKGKSYTGGIAGYVDASAQLTQCYSYGDVQGHDYVGGLAGFIGDEKPRTISGPGGVLITLPHGVPESSVTIKANDGSGLLRSGEKSASSAIQIELDNKDFLTGSRDPGAGFPLFEIRFPVTLSNPISDRLRVRVRLFDDVMLPVYGQYDPELKMYTIYTYGLGNSWILGTIDGKPVKTISVKNAIHETREPSENKWPTLEFEIKDESIANPKPISEEQVKTFILPIARDVLINFQSAGFAAPDLISDPSSNAYQFYLIDSDMGNGVIKSSYYSAPTAGLLGGIYIYYPSYITDYQNLSTWNLKNVISHEIFHSVQSGYGASYSVVQSDYYNTIYSNYSAKSVTSYLEGTATLVGGTFASASGIEDGTVKIDGDYSYQNIGNALDDYHSNPYAKQDFYAFLSKRHFNGSLTFLNPLWRSFAKTAPYNPNESTGDVLLKYRQGFDQFLRASSLSLPSVYTDFAMQRLYIHDPEYLLRGQDDENTNPNNWFAKNFLASILLEDGKTFKKWNSSNETIYDYNPIKIEALKSLTSASIVMNLPEMVAEENRKDSIELKLVLSANANVNQNLDEEGIRIVIIRAKSENGNPVENNPSVVIKDISKPFKISLKDGVTHLVFIFINAYTKFTDTDIMLESLQQNMELVIKPDPIKSEPDKEIKLLAESISTPPNDAKYVWNFGDGTSEVIINNDNTVEHKFTEVGDFKVVVRLDDNTAGKTLATGTAIAKIASNTANSFSYNWLQRKYTRDWFYDVNFYLSGSIDEKNNNKVEQIVENNNSKILNINFTSIDSFKINFESSFFVTPNQIISTQDPNEVLTFKGPPRMSWSTLNFIPEASENVGYGTFQNAKSLGTIIIKGSIDYQSVTFSDITNKYETYNGVFDWILAYIELGKY